MINRFNFGPAPDPAPGDENHFDQFADRLDSLLSEYSHHLTIGELISTLTVTQHSLITQSIQALQDEDDDDS